MSSIEVWERIYRLGLFGLLAVVISGLLKVASFSVGVHDGSLSEGSDFLQIISVGGFGVFILAGFSLLIPTVRFLFRSTDDHFKTVRGVSAKRIAWTIVIMMFPFIATYLFFALMMRRENR